MKNFFTFFIFLSVAGFAGAAEKKPNLIFLMADDQNTLSVGCYGNPEVQTPNIDRLGRDGMIFERQYDTTAICMGSRANVFTGRYEYKTGCNFGHGNLAAKLWGKSYPQLLRKAGYLTAFAGKFGIVVEGKGICEADFDFYGGGPGQTHYETAKHRTMKRFAGEYPHSTLAYGAFGCEVIRESVKQDKPFCLSSFMIPEAPRRGKGCGAVASPGISTSHPPSWSWPGWSRRRAWTGRVSSPCSTTPNGVVMRSWR